MSDTASLTNAKELRPDRGGGLHRAAASARHQGEQRRAARRNGPLGLGRRHRQLLSRDALLRRVRALRPLRRPLPPAGRDHRLHQRSALRTICTTPTCALRCAAAPTRSARSRSCSTRGTSTAWPRSSASTGRKRQHHPAAAAPSGDHRAQGAASPPTRATRYPRGRPHLHHVARALVLRLLEGRRSQVRRHRDQHRRAFLRHAELRLRRAAQNVVHHRAMDCASGYLEYEKARVRWFLSINVRDVPDDVSRQAAHVPLDHGRRRASSSSPRASPTCTPSELSRDPGRPRLPARRRARRRSRRCRRSARCRSSSTRASSTRSWPECATTKCDINSAGRSKRVRIARDLRGPMRLAASVSSTLAAL